MLFWLQQQCFVDTLMQVWTPYLELLSGYRRLHLEMHYGSMYGPIVHGEFKPLPCLQQHKSCQLLPGLSCCHQVASADENHPPVLEVQNAMVLRHQYDRLQKLSFSGQARVPSCQCFPNYDDELVLCSICPGHTPVRGLLLTSFDHDDFQNLNNEMCHRLPKSIKPGDHIIPHLGNI